MANLTKAQRHNRNLDNIFNDYNGDKISYLQFFSIPDF